MKLLSCFHGKFVDIFLYLLVLWSICEGEELSQQYCQLVSKITVGQLTDLNSIWKKRVVQKARQFMSHPDHILSQEFCLMPSGRHYLAHQGGQTDFQILVFLQPSFRLLNAETVK